MRLQLINFLLCAFLVNIFLLADSLDKHLRDPFFLSVNKKEKPIKQMIILLGVVRVADKISAVIKIGNQQKTISLGDRVSSFIVDKIDLDEIVLKKGKKKYKIPYLQGKGRECCP